MTGILAYRDKFPQLGKRVFIAPGAWVIGDVIIGDRSSIWFNTIVRGDENYVRIGSETNIQDNSTLHVSRGEFPLKIGDRVVVGHRAIVHGCTVESDCLIGMGAVILDGAVIGAGSLVGAGAVVTPGFIAPPRSFLIGIPAIIRKQVGDTEAEMIRDSVLHYMKLAEDYLSAGDPQEKRTRKEFPG